jgi:hypothetical protein
VGLAALLALASLAAVAAPVPARGPAGKVVSVGADAAYLDRGRKDGLAVGQAVPVFRAGKQVGTCTVVNVSDSNASCTGTGLRAGDRLTVERKATAPVAAFVPPTSRDALEARKAAVDAAPWTQVDDAAGVSGRLGLGLSVTFTHQTFIDFGSARPAYGLERLDVSLTDVKLRKDLSLSLDATALMFTSRPSPDRYPGGNLTLLLHRASLRWAPEGSGLVVQAGRVRPRGTPGLLALDGAQAGWRFKDNAVEAGVFGGLLPTSALLEPSTSWAAGAYGAARLTSGDGANGSTLQADGRVGWASRPNLGTRFEAGVAAHAWLGRSANAHLSALLASGSPVAPSVVDSVSFDLGLTPSERFRLHLNARYRGNPMIETELPGVVLPTTQSGHASLDGWFELWKGVELGVRAGGAREVNGPLGTVWAGPELALTQLLDGHAMVTAGYEEDVGGVRGRSLWGQGTWSPSRVWRFTARASWAMQVEPTLLGSMDLGGTLIAEVRPFAIGWFRVSGTWRSPLAVGPLDGGVMKGSLAQVLGQAGVDL